MSWCGKVRLADLQPDAARGDKSQVDDLADPGVSGLSRTRRYRLKGMGNSGRGWSPGLKRKDF
jgi:hypothetical protein